MGKKQNRRGKHFYLFFAWIIIAPLGLSGCAHFYEELITRSDFREAGAFFRENNFQESVNKYDQIIAGHPQVGDTALFKMGVVYASPRNGNKDYLKSLECFQRLVKNYPESSFRPDSEVLIFLINDILVRDKNAVTQRRQIDKLEQQIVKLEQQIDKLEQQNVKFEQHTDKLKQQVEKLKQQGEEYERKIEKIKEVDMHLKQRKKTSP